jgi:cytoskeleton protein RodZ
MTSIGEALRSERMRRNLELEQISRELKIPQRLLSAIENDKFDQLRGAVFAKSFVRQYAGLLGLDAEEMAARVGEMFASEPGLISQERSQHSAAEMDLPRLEAWETVGGGRRFSRASSLPALALVVLVMLVCSGVYTFWQRSRRIAAAREAAAPVEQAARKAVPVPAAVPAPVTAPVPAAPPAPTPEAAATPPGEPPPAAAKTEEPSAKPPAGETAVAAAEPKPEPPKSQEAERLDPNAPVRVELVALGEVWVRAQSDGKYKFSGTLNPNETRAVNANAEVVVRVGNAGLIDIQLNGKSIGTVGPKGQIRTVQLTPGGFKIVAPEPKPAPPPSDPF